VYHKFKKKKKKKKKNRKLGVKGGMKEVKDRLCGLVVRVSGYRSGG
jgi:hypothetical protein